MAACLYALRCDCQALSLLVGTQDALRPFVSVLRQCDDASVRELAVRCIAQAVAAHPRGLGSGWRMALVALEQAAQDDAPPVVAQALEALQARPQTDCGT
jgi:hypothetical protein